jgi:hypothetical protein
MSQALKTRINNLAAEVSYLRGTTQSSLTVAGNDSTSYKLIDEGTVRSLKTQSPLTLTANATDKSLTIGGVPDPSNYATTAALNAKQEQLTFSGDDTVEGGFQLGSQSTATLRKLVSGSRLNIQQSADALTLSVADNPTFTNLTVSNTLTAAAIQCFERYYGDLPDCLLQHHPNQERLRGSRASRDASNTT